MKNDNVIKAALLGAGTVGSGVYALSLCESSNSC